MDCNTFYLIVMFVVTLIGPILVTMYNFWGDGKLHALKVFAFIYIAEILAIVLSISITKFIVWIGETYFNCAS